jgi:hypothetical protein
MFDLAGIGTFQSLFQRHLNGVHSKRTVQLIDAGRQ